MSFQELKKVYQAELGKIKSHLEAFPWEDKDAYGNWCAQTYYYVCHSTRLLALSASRIPLQQDEHYQRYLKHISEEDNHEKLAFGDLKKLGYQPKDFPELPVTAAFYQTQYYYIEHQNVFALFGYILILEGMSAAFGMGCYQRAKAAHGAPATNFWRVHAEEDPGHIDQAFKYIETLDADAIAAITRNLKESTARYGELLDTCARTRKTGKRAA